MVSIIVGCASPGIPGRPADNKKAGKILSEYIIQPGDMLLIDIIENTTSSRTVPVRPDGKISLPQVNDVQAAGLTPLQLRENLIKEYSQFYTVVEVTVTVTGITGYKINIIGNVRSQGQIILHDRTTFLEAMSMAGGLDEWADRKKIYIMRKGDKGQEKIPLDYDKIIQGTAEDIWILPGDMIVVP